MNAQPPKSYDRVVKTIHWTSLVLVAAAYTIVWLAGAAATKEAKTALLTLHRSIGLTIFAVTLFRIAWYARAAVPSLPADMSRVQKFAAHATQTLLGALLLAQPVLGLVHSNAQGWRQFLFSRPIAGHCRRRPHRSRSLRTRRMARSPTCC